MSLETEFKFKTPNISLKSLKKKNLKFLRFIQIVNIVLRKSDEYWLNI